MASRVRYEHHFNIENRADTKSYANRTYYVYAIRSLVIIE